MHENCKANIFHKHHNESLVSLMKQENNASEATFSTKFTFERLFPFMQLENMSSPEIDLFEFCTNVYCISWQLALGLVCSTTETCYSTVSQPSNSWIWWHLNNDQFRKTYSILSFGLHSLIFSTTITTERLAPVL